VADSDSSLKTKMQEDASFVRAYGKNEMYTGRHVATKLWVGDYTTGKTAKCFAAEAEGIDRIGILRADVDNLGHAFVSGFENKENHNRYVTLSRTATLSRQLSLFFKFYIRKILEQPDYKIGDRSLKERNATICYSGGDDLFIIGSWNEVIELAVDIRRKFETYTQRTLTLSAGIGIYTPGYPIHASAGEVAHLEDDAKKLPGKNAVTVFPDGKDHPVRDESGKENKINDATYPWKQFEDQVIGEKYAELARFFGRSDERGKNFLYHLLELIRSREDKIYFARYVYILSRLEPEADAPQAQKENYKTFSEKMYRWYLKEEDCRQLRTAMTLYAYLTREKEEKADENQ
jgi:CRISPR-associated protein Csm1